MANPLVCAVMLTCDRHAMAKRALRCFEMQTQAHRLFILDSGNDCFLPDHSREVLSRFHYYRLPGQHQTIGALRNIANERAIAKYQPDILMHMDDDDWSAPTRLAEQVAHLQASGADVVGFSDMLFWASERGGLIFDEANANRPGKHWPEDVHRPAGEAWLFNNHKPNYALGTSLMYWRKTWERKQFPEHTNPGCDDRLWVEGLKVASVSSIYGLWNTNPAPGISEFETEARMVAEIHGQNTCARITEPSTDWTRVPAWDEKLRSIMAL